MYATAHLTYVDAACLCDMVLRVILWRQIGDKTDHDISCRRSFLTPWKIALRVVVLLSSRRRVPRFVVI